MLVEVKTTPFDANGALSRFTLSRPNAGACVSFLGTCRADSANGAVLGLELQHYPGFTEQEIGREAKAILSRFDLLDLLIIHRVGRVAPGDAIVLAAALSAHRAAAFTAVEVLMDYLKTDAPFWKQELREDGWHWIEPTKEDVARSARHKGDLS